MAKDEHKEFNKEYYELRLRYALENPEVKNLFDDWINAEKKLIGVLHKYGVWESIESARPVHDEADELWNSLFRILQGLGIIFYTSRDIYAAYCNVTKKKNWDYNDVFPRILPSVFIEADSRELRAAHLKKTSTLSGIYLKRKFREAQRVA